MELKKHQATAQNDEDLASLVVHFTPKEVLQHPRYKKWIEEFSPSTHHLILNECSTCMGSQSVHRIQYKLNMLSEDMFPLLGDKGTQLVNEASSIHVNKKQKCEATSYGNCTQTDLNLSNLSVESRPTSPSEPYIFPNTFCSYHLRPKKGLDRTCELRINPKEYISETMSIDDFADTLQELHRDLSQSRKRLSIREYPKILFLGTGSCIPNKTRNTSGILLTLSETQNVLLDCGEGTYGQIVRFFGQEAADRVLSNIDCVYISHLHADHHIGLVGLLQGRRRALDNLKLNKEPLYLFARSRFWLGSASTTDILNNPTLPQSEKQKILEKLGMMDINTCLVRHCPNAFGVALTDKHGHKITYSGDTMPSDNLVELGISSDVLIHEATMEDELAHEAITKMHSTTSPSDRNREKNGKPRIFCLPTSARGMRSCPDLTTIFLIMLVSPSITCRMDELPLVPKLYPSLRLMFAEHYEELEHKAVKRQLKIERQREASLTRNKEKLEQATQ
ncbi:hypothetical protein NQ318_000323 [Aromia moschata]|uniref:ribonuclease Z n=1 Tax=Aromia moschata TaxID=1265417 RepID=A0AAV8XRN5_9CUCU|nr:hypothetical protein NQ318_000323 [Aromia moschata]